MKSLNRLLGVAAFAAGTAFVGLSLPAHAAPVGPIATAKASVAPPAERTCFSRGYGSRSYGWYGRPRVYGWRGYGWRGARVFGWRGWGVRRGWGRWR